MSTKQNQPKALRLADALDAVQSFQYACHQSEHEIHPAAAELRRLHALNAELVEVLSACEAWIHYTRRENGMDAPSVEQKARAILAKAKAQQ